MLLAATVALLSTDPVDLFFDRLVAGHQSITRQQITARATTQGQVRNQQIYTLQIERPDRVALWWTDGKKDLGARAWYEPEAFTLYDRATGQFARSFYDRQAGTTLAQRIRSYSPGVDELVVMLADPAGIQALRERLEQENKWEIKATPTGPQISSLAGAGKVMLRAHPRTGRMLAFNLTDGTNTTRWTMEYAPLTQTAQFRPPQGAFEVDKIDPAYRDPKFADARSRRVMMRAFQVFDSPQRLAYEVVDSTGSYRVAIQRNAVGQISGEHALYYERNQARVVDQQVAYAGKASVRQVVDAMHRAGTRVEPFLSQLIKRRNPLRHLINQNTTVRHTGTQTVDGRTMEMLEVKAPNADLILIIEEDGFLREIMTQPKDKDGEHFELNVKKFRRINFDETLREARDRRATQRRDIASLLPRES